MTGLFSKTISSAYTSSCGMYRYSLKRVWDSKLPLMCWIMVNPSSADASKNDPTIRACIAFATKWGYGGFTVANLFAFRSPKPEVLIQKAQEGFDVVGPENDLQILESASVAKEVVFAWGNNGSFRGRDKEVIELIRENRSHSISHLGLTKTGQPRHPKWTPIETERISWL